MKYRFEIFSIVLHVHAIDFLCWCHWKIVIIWIFYDKMKLEVQQVYVEASFPENVITTKLWNFLGFTSIFETYNFFIF